MKKFDVPFVRNADRSLAVKGSLVTKTGTVLAEESMEGGKNLSIDCHNSTGNTDRNCKRQGYLEFPRDSDEDTGKGNGKSRSFA